MFAEVIIPLNLPNTYTWAVPEHLQENIETGCRVEVELRKKKYAGIVKKIHFDKPAAFEPKNVLNVLDDEPILYEQQLNLWRWMSNYYLCSEGEVMAAALPSHFKLSSETIIVYNEEYGDDFSELDHDEYLVAEALLIKHELKLTEIQEILDVAHIYPVIKRLIEKKCCFVWESLKDTYKKKKDSFVVLAPQYDNEDQLEQLLNKWTKAPKQLELLLSYLHLIKTEGEVTRSALLKKSNAGDAQLKGLVEKGILLIQKKAIDRLQYLPKQIEIDFELSLAQQKAYEQTLQSFSQHAVTLLHGYTSSGKTQIYIKLIEQSIKIGKQVLYLLPEIALTAQIIRRLQKHFGGYIGIFHSKFNQNERIEIWNKVKNGELKVVLGARSALFLPFQNLELIIVDEEHDTSYKQQEPAPRYNARDASIYYASQLNAKVLLGSATPSIESYFNAANNKYGLVELFERFGQIQMPNIQIIDTKKNTKEKIILSDELKLAIEHSVASNQQVILFQNRRGYSPYQICKVCGWIPHCLQCDVSLTFHKVSNKLQCHYCGSVYAPVNTCIACGNHHFIKRNFGTEKIEEFLNDELPDLRIARMDMDSVRGKQAHDQLIQRFERHEIDVLVGTQMVVKGLDFENVGLVGILDADSLLSFTDFRVNERAFQLMEQVSGRAGRKNKQGLVMIQVMNTQHPVLQFVKEHDYKKIYDFELPSRKQFFYPPFSRLIKLTFKHKNKDVMESAANFVAHYLKNEFEQYIIGPAEPIIGRIRNQFLMELLLKLPKDSHLIHRCKTIMQQQIAILHNERKFSSVVVVADVDTLD